MNDTIINSKDEASIHIHPAVVAEKRYLIHKVKGRIKLRQFTFVRFMEWLNHVSFQINMYYWRSSVFRKRRQMGETSKDCKALDSVSHLGIKAICDIISSPADMNTIIYYL